MKGGGSSSRVAGRIDNGRPARDAGPAPAELRHRLLTALTRLHGAAVRSYNKLVRGLDVPFEQWLVLAEMSRHESISMGELTRLLGFNFSTLTRIADRMVNSSLIYRQVDPDDRRKVVMVLTDEGYEKLAQIDRQLDGALLSADALESEGLSVLAHLSRLADRFPEA